MTAISRVVVRWYCDRCGANSELSGLVVMPMGWGRFDGADLCGTCMDTDIETGVVVVRR